MKSASPKRESVSIRSRSECMALVRARAAFTDAELLDEAARWHMVDPRIAWEYREAWAIRCVEGKEEYGGEG